MTVTFDHTARWKKKQYQLTSLETAQLKIAWKKSYMLKENVKPPTEPVKTCACLQLSVWRL